MDEESESIVLGTLLAVSGGLMDAYSYILRGQVFANAQTGNILFLGIYLCSGQWREVIHYLFPVAGFTAGIFISELMHLSRLHPVHWKQTILLAEAFLLLLVPFIPLDLFANSLTSFVCGMQVQTFRKLRGHPFATTMCIGNLRSGTVSVVNWLCHREHHHLRAAGAYYYVIFCFVIGAVIGNALAPVTGLFTIAGCTVLLMVSWVILHFQHRKSQHTLDELDQF
ncbi:YoaK family protein [Faecalibaculum rodentium]|uniref:YoaK family protein n=3 Tax=Faecalibaculum rodentium TaxID=1702221 RepID=UPI0023EF6CB9|nr:YoaK family protein [Faecalibaculum rodentium]